VRAERVFIGLGAALALATVLRMPAAWESGNALNHVSGAWMALADDLARGTFYRPVFDPEGGYGGTRFFPLAFALHAGLARAGADLLASGYAVSLGAGALLVVGLFLLLRGLGLARPAALAFAALSLAGFAGQHGLSSVRGDVLPVALSALGLAAIARNPSLPRLALAGILLALAFAAKPTALTATAAAVVWLAARREPRAAAVLASIVGALAAGVVFATDALSDGRFLAILRACAMGGAALGDAARAPVRLLHYFLVADPWGLALSAAAVVALSAAVPALLRARRTGGPAASPLLLPALWLGVAAGGVLVVFASPGTGVNHLVELEATAAVVLGVATRAGGAGARAARLAAPVVAAVGIALVLSMWRTDREESRLDEIRAIVRALPHGPALSEDPLVPILAGARPLMLDPWMLRLASAGDPGLARGLVDDLARGEYAAVVLFQDLADPLADAWYADRNLGIEVIAEIRRSYRRTGGSGRYHLYVPRTSGRAMDDEPRVTAADRRSSVAPLVPAR
jgi:hypothetical protein